MINVQLPYKMKGRLVSDMNVPGEVIVVAITRDGKTFLPTPKAEFAEGDTIHLAVQFAAMYKVKDMFGS